MMDPSATDDFDAGSGDMFAGFDIMDVDVDTLLREAFPEAAGPWELRSGSLDPKTPVSDGHSSSNPVNNIFPGFFSFDTQSWGANISLDMNTALAPTWSPLAQPASFESAAGQPPLMDIDSEPAVPMVLPAYQGITGSETIGSRCPINTAAVAAAPTPPGARMNGTQPNVSRSQPPSGQPAYKPLLPAIDTTDTSPSGTHSIAIPPLASRTSTALDRPYGIQGPIIPAARPSIAGPSKEEWAAMKTTIKGLYIDFNLPLRDVILVMEKRHGFRAT